MNQSVLCHNLGGSVSDFQVLCLSESEAEKIVDLCPSPKFKPCPSLKKSRVGDYFRAPYLHVIPCPLIPAGVPVWPPLCRRTLVGKIFSIHTNSVR